MKKQIALVLAGTAAIVAGYLRLVQELIDRENGGNSGDSAKRVREEQSAPASSEATEATGFEPPAGARASVGESKAELYEKATELGVSGRSKMSKAELVEAINRAG